MRTTSDAGPRAQDAEQRGILARERIFDDILEREGVVTHYLPLGQEGEKGIDVWPALEAYELASGEGSRNSEGIGDEDAEDTRGFVFAARNP